MEVTFLKQTMSISRMLVFDYFCYERPRVRSAFENVPSAAVFVSVLRLFTVYAVNLDYENGLGLGVWTM